MHGNEERRLSLGRVLFLGFLLAIILILVFGPRQDKEDHTIIVGDAELAQMVVSWQKTWQRLPTREELEGLINKYVRDEVLYRESLERGLDKNNGVIKRALVTQMTFLGENQGGQPEISEEDIEAYYRLRSDKFQLPARISFHQVYFDQDRDLHELNKYVNDWNRDNIPWIDAKLVGDQIMLPDSFQMLEKPRVANQLGESFADSLFNLTVDQWSGPVRSGYGWHIVYISQKVNPRPAPLEDVREEILREIEYEQREAAKDQFYTELLRGYNVVYSGGASDIIDPE